MNLTWIRQRTLNQLDDLSPIIGMNPIFESGLRSAKSARRQTVHCLQFRRPSIHPRPNIQFKGPDAGGLLCQSQPLFADA
jgi:hypothetical protein